MFLAPLALFCSACGTSVRATSKIRQRYNVRRPAPPAERRHDRRRRRRRRCTPAAAGRAAPGTRQPGLGPVRGRDRRCRARCCSASSGWSPRRCSATTTNPPAPGSVRRSTSTAPATAPAGDEAGGDAPSATATAPADVCTGRPPPRRRRQRHRGGDRPPEQPRTAPTAGDTASPPSGDDDFSDDPRRVAADHADRARGQPARAAQPGAICPSPATNRCAPRPGHDADAAVDAPRRSRSTNSARVRCRRSTDGARHDRSTDHVAFTHDGELVEVFTLDGVADRRRGAGAVLRRRPARSRGARRVRRPPGSARRAPGSSPSPARSTRRPRPASRARRRCPGTILAAVRPDGTAVVLTTSRSPASSLATTPNCSPRPPTAEC